MKAGLYQTSIAEVVGVHKRQLVEKYNVIKAFEDIALNMHIVLLRRDVKKLLVPESLFRHGLWLSVSCEKTGAPSKSVAGLIVRVR